MIEYICDVCGKEISGPEFADSTIPFRSSPIVIEVKAEKTHRVAFDEYMVKDQPILYKKMQVHKECADKLIEEIAGVLKKYRRTNHR